MLGNKGEAADQGPWEMNFVTTVIIQPCLHCFPTLFCFQQMKQVLEWADPNSVFRTGCKDTPQECYTEHTFPKTETMCHL